MKEKASFTNIDEYIVIFPLDVQPKLLRLREVINSCSSDFKEVISYQIPTFKLEKNVIHFACYKNHIGLYPGLNAIEHFKKELKEYKLSKGTIQFPINKELPYDLIKRITNYCIDNKRT